MAAIFAASDQRRCRVLSRLAKAYLEKARAKAEALPAHELLTEIFALKAEIAEAEGRYANALEYTKKNIFTKKNSRAGAPVSMCRTITCKRKKNNWLPRKKARNWN